MAKAETKLVIPVMSKVDDLAGEVIVAGMAVMGHATFNENTNRYEVPAHIIERLSRTIHEHSEAVWQEILNA